MEVTLYRRSTPRCPANVGGESRKGLATPFRADGTFNASSMYGVNIRASTVTSQASIHSHSIINRSRKPAWLKGLAMIDIGHYRRFYRLPARALSCAEDGGI